MREFTIGNRLQDVVVEGDQISFAGRRSFSRKTQTAWKAKAKGTGLYSLESLLHYVKNMDKPVTEYMRLARAPGVSVVSFLDRKVFT